METVKTPENWASSNRATSICNKAGLDNAYDTYDKCTGSACAEARKNYQTAIDNYQICLGGMDPSQSATSPMASSWLPNWLTTNWSTVSLVAIMSVVGVVLIINRKNVIHV